MITATHPVFAALINVGAASPLVGLIVLIIVVGIVVLIAAKLIEFIPMDGNFKQLAIWLIYLVAALIVIVKAFEILFGITLF